MKLILISLLILSLIIAGCLSSTDYIPVKPSAVIYDSHGGNCHVTIENVSYAAYESACSKIVPGETNWIVFETTSSDHFISDSKTVNPYVK